MDRHRAMGARLIAAVATVCLALGLSLSPGALAEHGAPSAATCAGLKPMPLPPSVYADPACIVKDDNENPFHVEPTLETKLNVHIVWSYDRPEATTDVDSFVVYRGTAPSGLYAIGEIDAGDAWEFEDEWQWAGNGAVWYAIAATHANGDLVMSNAYLVQPAAE